ncbi:uncharacterized protein MYCGRDRAFT_33410 [Zymoseptoria tritici IPO323]|uniref:TAFII55 protein conserved region domain-containing protein n=1 Tax=Zymoseptoria tritici (strain CBS 115943 / IPO323) TaxID=336722 RepID=F9X1D7_ZYMTI|nr:uncharacterized protein MYCGRDRAFT_33410 [Zymoseptoria tritici IPO323]EGP91569.1 hypothetical protein MYCGRDRAFT_33410 [Zymoseptoria tritici IPO323]
MIKLKLGKGTASQAPGSTSQNTASSPSTAAPAQQPPVKLKLSVSQPPTPITQPPNAGFPPTDPPAKKKRAYVRKDPDSKKANSKKRAADDDTISPAPKRAASGPSRKISLKIPNNNLGEDGRGLAKIPLIKKRPSVPKFVELRARGKAPPRPKGVGYDSEDSDTEKDPAIQQALILRMEPGEDADYIREAIAEGKIGPHPSQGDAEVSLKFVEKTYRRAMVRVRGRMYGAVLVDLPCVVESMKSFDKKGWWKVADVTQMLLVLGRCGSEEEARSLPLPREVNKDTFQYAHGLTPPMHWVRKRRFRKRLNYTQVQNVEEEVAKLLEQDAQWELGGGKVVSETLSRMEMERSQEPQDYDFEDDEDAEGEAVDTVETDQYDMEVEDDEPDEDLEANLQAMFDDEEDAPSAMPSEAATPISTPAGEAAQTSASDDDEEDGSDEDSDDDDDADSMDAVDEDALAKAAEKAQQMEEVADLEREVERARQKVKAMTNQLLRQREVQKLAALEEDLRVKKGVFGLDDGEDSEEG